MDRVQGSVLNNQSNSANIEEMNELKNDEDLKNMTKTEELIHLNILNNDLISNNAVSYTHLTLPTTPYV